MLSYKLLEHLEPIYTCRSSFRTKPSIEEKTGSMRGVYHVIVAAVKGLTINHCPPLTEGIQRTEYI